MKFNWIKPYEFWHPRVFEVPFYIYLLFQCLINRIGIRDLARANYALDHGEIGLGSKYQTQLKFDQKWFLPTELMLADLTTEQRCQRIQTFAGMHGYPVIVKPDVGMVGKGILKFHSDEEVIRRCKELDGAFLLQKFTPLPVEYGVFYMRHKGVSKISGINRKHFPTVVGNGKDSILTLAENHYRYTSHWPTFLQYIDVHAIPEAGEEVCLSFIGSHTMGCLFTDDSHLVSPALEQSVFELFNPQQGFNYGRMDVKCESEEAFQRGEFVVIEVNGISSLPTHMFDPDNSLFRAYQIFFQHGKSLAQIAREYRHQSMPLLPLLEVARKVRDSQSRLDNIHQKLKQ